MLTSDQRFALCFPITEQYEGWHQFSNDPYDPGGATWCGMTQRAYDAYRRQIGEPLQSVRRASDVEIANCFRVNYWNAVRGDQLPGGIDLIIYDCAINNGPPRAIKFLQQALGVQVDGWLGLETFGALQKCTDLAGLIDKIEVNRMSFWHMLTTWWRFGLGWTRRGVGVAADAKKMIGE